LSRSTRCFPKVQARCHACSIRLIRRVWGQKLRARAAAPHAASSLHSTQLMQEASRKISEEQRLQLSILNILLRAGVGTMLMMQRPVEETVPRVCRAMFELKFVRRDFVSLPGRSLGDLMMLGGQEKVWYAVLILDDHHTLYIVWRWHRYAHLVRVHGLHDNLVTCAFFESYSQPSRWRLCHLVIPGEES